MNPTDRPVRDETGWSQLQIEFNRACSASLMRDKRITEWERKFLADMMQRCDRFGALPKWLSERQAETIQGIASKVQDIVGL